MVRPAQTPAHLSWCSPPRAQLAFVGLQTWQRQLKRPYPKRPLSLCRRKWQSLLQHQHQRLLWKRHLNPLLWPSNRPWFSQSKWPKRRLRRHQKNLLNQPNQPPLKRPKPPKWSVGSLCLRRCQPKWQSWRNEMLLHFPPIPRQKHHLRKPMVVAR
jgi:hypothetical protein